MNTYLNYNLLSTDYTYIATDIICFLAILSSILVISTSNPVISVLFLISLFINIAIYLIMIGITYIGLTYIVVYIGAVTILFLFVIMLLDIKLSEIKLDSENSNGIPLGIIIGISFLYPIWYSKLSIILDKQSSSGEITNNLLNLILDLNQWLSGFNPKINENYNIENNFTYVSNEQLEKIVTLLWDNNIYTYTHVTGIGNMLYTSYVIWFIIIALILLLAMVGAISLTLKSSN